MSPPSNMEPPSRQRPHRLFSPDRRATALKMTMGGRQRSATIVSPPPFPSPFFTSSPHVTPVTDSLTPHLPHTLTHSLNHSHTHTPSTCRRPSSTPVPTPPGRADLDLHKRHGHRVPFSLMRWQSYLSLSLSLFPSFSLSIPISLTSSRSVAVTLGPRE
ncbi:uncharacterized protein LY79DRAFT_564951 [Colletotrichum navitas]|uniref:Uncharacterized protein n=1 Tax=Colletotrichum navitas TaxID=681940 RepID=A0AAD8PR09_9PEZI|nr:uncharacterized protein LY79DRAFT_564951 [Colletotrichum navitas]KAK1579168.1 hypothetical protein LY79DRAFT_564951 [Colletotrichum navitas]